MKWIFDDALKEINKFKRCCVTGKPFNCRTNWEMPNSNCICRSDVILSSKVKMKTASSMKWLKQRSTNEPFWREAGPFFFLYGLINDSLTQNNILIQTGRCHGTKMVKSFFFSGWNNLLLLEEVRHHTYCIYSSIILSSLMIWFSAVLSAEDVNCQRMLSETLSLTDRKDEIKV